jgi:hypothetical protein
MQNKKKPESIIEEQILWGLYKSKLFAWKNPTTGYFDTRLKVFRKHSNPFAINGVSDILAIQNGRFIAVEVKSEKGKPTADQIKFIEKINSNGGIAIIARSWEDAKKQLLEAGIVL